MKSLSEFREAVKEIAVSIGKKYWSVKVELSEHESGGTEVSYRSYIDGYSGAVGITPEESIHKLKVIIGLEKPKCQTDIEI